jgi:heme exporter protein CcmD
LNQWPFIVAAYAVALLATAGLVLWSYAAMRRAERDAEALRGDR